MFLRLVPIAKTYPTGTLTLAGNAAAGETVTLDDRVYTWRASLSSGGVSREVLIGATASDSCDNLIAAVNGAAGEGTLYGLGTTPNQAMRGVAGAGDTVDFTSLVEGLGGQAATTETMGSGSFGAATLTMAGVTAGTSAPTITDATAGMPLPPGDQAVVLVHSTAGSGTMTVTVKMWGFHKRLGRWFELGTLNAGNAIGESGVADTIAYVEGMTGLRYFSRVLAQITAIAGTNTAVMVHLDVNRSDTTTDS